MECCSKEYTNIYLNNNKIIYLGKELLKQCKMRDSELKYLIPTSLVKYYNLWI